MRLSAVKRWFRPAISAAAIASLGLSACDDAASPNEPEPSIIDAPLDDLDVLLDGAPDPDKLPDEPKSDQTYPPVFTDLVALQSPVRNQQSRGVCSIFSTVALMEHLYIKEGTFKNPDFSEQFLQWSSKVEVGAFQNTGGSNATSNLQAISRFGIVLEQDWPYEGRGWSTANDERCTGDDRPIICWTNGDPSDAVRNDVDRFRLPPSRYVSSRKKSIQAFMFNNKQAVVAGMTFFYQSWNHGGSKLPTNSEYSRAGYVLYPNEADKTSSLEKRAGHSILLVGWDENLEVQQVDDKGQPVVDADGNPVMEKGFFLFKNSWGDAGTFGSKNPHGHGYGWISMKYVEEYASVVGSNVPTVNLGPEVCGDGTDNNFDGLIDCQEIAACGTNAACTTASRTFKASPNAAIPDNNEAGYASTISVDSTGFATSVYVDVQVKHPFVRDLKLVLTAPTGRQVVLYDRALPSGRDIYRRFEVPALVGEDVSGNWTLTVSDLNQGDTGRLAYWELGLGLPAGTPVEDCTDGRDNTGNGKTDCQDAACSADPACQANNPGELVQLSDTVMPIPDNNSAGAKSQITLSGPGLVDGIEVDVDVRHSYRGDLTLKLVHPDGSVVTLSDKQGGSAPNIDETFSTRAFDGKKAAGTYTLWVVDGAAGDTGTLNAWLLSVTTK